MSEPSLWTGLAESAFLADLDARDRAPLRILGTLGGGLAAAFVAGVCVYCLTMIPYTLFSGRGGAGLDGLTQAAVAMSRPETWDFHTTTAFLVIVTAIDAAPLVAFVALAASLARRPLLAYATSAPRLRWPLLLMGLALSTVVLAPLVVAERALGGDAPPPVLAPGASGLDRVVYILAALMVVPAAAAEELLFRGWLVRQTAAFVGRTGPLLLVSSTLFAAAHFVRDPLGADPDAFLQIALMGAGYAYMTLRLGGIEFAAGAHAGNNLLIILFIQPLRPELPSGGGGPLALVVDLALLVGYFIITEAVVRWPLLRRLGRVRAGEISPPDDGLASEYG
jgi:membrane protease YdiL (CAAX protease family)